MPECNEQYGNWVVPESASDAYHSADVSHFTLNRLYVFLGPCNYYVSHGTIVGARV